ncbi:hypothetical protein [Gracilibacillus salinarum]|uniref:AP2 domain-containing protein n=1 Tax=Gracilibacillus salinarum TaxID=2932255 RepID=A0ABY4GPP5_9BACI|nr:hypothetical protein [Gracilibacillus salinarum]UOQ86204.1 hypothetical protein MUN87_04715 [Gracilibacillus salinarum]
MAKLKNITGKTYGRLTVMKRVENSKNGHACWLCECECGGAVIVSGDNLRNGNTKSCGCLSMERSSTNRMTNTRIYSTWRNMMNRCYNDKHDSYKNYGAKGVQVCDHWREDFLHFYRDVVEAYNAHALEHSEKQTTLDRINPEGNYEPGNVRFATYKVQASNKRAEA